MGTTERSALTRAYNLQEDAHHRGRRAALCGRSGASTFVGAGQAAHDGR